MWVWKVVLVLLLAAAAVRRYRADRARGVRINWIKTITLVVVILVLVLAGLSALLLLMRANRLVLGLVAFVVILLGGFIPAVKLIGRRWPDPPPPA